MLRGMDEKIIKKIEIILLEKSKNGKGRERVKGI